MEKLRILFIGPAGAGKGTQAAKLAEEFKLEHISTGDLIRAEIKSESPLGLEVKAIVESGKLVSDEIVNAIVKNKLISSECPPHLLAQFSAIVGVLCLKNERTNAEKTKTFLIS